MALIFYQYTVPFNCPLYADYYVDRVFIAYNPEDGETAFFSVDCGDDGGEVRPFDSQEMRYVENRYHEWCIAHPEKATVACDKSIVLFDKEAHASFMRSLL